MATPLGLNLFEKFEKLVSKLPKSISEPIVRETGSLKNFFLLQRPPRIVLLGARSIGTTQIVSALFREPVGDPMVEETVGWQSYSRLRRGTIRILDARGTTSLPAVKTALLVDSPDVFLFLKKSTLGVRGTEMDRTAELLDFLARRERPLAAIIGVEVAETSGASVGDLRESLEANPLIREHFSESATITASPESILLLVELIAHKMPDDARLEMARISHARSVQMEIARALIKSTTAICTAVGTQPIPLADFPILTALQVMMVAGIAHVSGREMSKKLAVEFLAAIGANLGVGMALREGSRAALKFLPVFGDAVSGAIAGAGTYAVGRSAAAYFIEGVSIKDAHGIFREKTRRKKPLAIESKRQ